MPAHTSTSLKPRADRKCPWRPSRSSRFVLQLENQFRATGDETGELGKTPEGRQQQSLHCSHLRSGSDVGQLPYCYIEPSAKLAVKPTNWWLRPNLERSARTDCSRLRRSSSASLRTAAAEAATSNPARRGVVEPSCCPSGIRTARSDLVARAAEELFLEKSAPEGIRTPDPLVRRTVFQATQVYRKQGVFAFPLCYETAGYPVIRP